MLYILWVWTNIMTCIHHYSITQSIFTALKFLCALPVHSLPHPPNPWSFIISIVLPFPEYHKVGIIQYAAFPNWLLSLSNKHLRFIPVFSWLDFFRWWIVSHCMGVTQFFYSLTYWRITWFFQFLELWIKIIQIFVCKFWWGHIFKSIG